MRISLVALLLLEGVPRALSFGVSSHLHKVISARALGILFLKAICFTSILGLFFCMLCLTQIWSSQLYVVQAWSFDLLWGTMICCQPCPKNWHRASCWFAGGWLGEVFSSPCNEEGSLLRLLAFFRGVRSFQKYLLYPHSAWTPASHLEGLYPSSISHELLWHQLPSIALVLSSHFVSRTCTFPISFDIGHALKFVVKC